MYQVRPMSCVKQKLQEIQKTNHTIYSRRTHHSQYMTGQVNKNEEYVYGRFKEHSR